jgi:hypothetical protein
MKKRARWSWAGTGLISKKANETSTADPKTPGAAPPWNRGEEARNPFKIGRVWIKGEGAADRLTAALAYTLALALAMEGQRAFEDPKTSAAFHEAGHCVIGALDGDPPTKASIWSEQLLGQPHWTGKTEGFSPWRVDDTTPAQYDLKQARAQLAGAASELLFDYPNYRAASSVDEKVIAVGIVQTAACKLKCDPQQLFEKTLNAVIRDLWANKEIVREIADVLLREGKIEPQPLSRILRAVRRP